jgi:hypothetical protein
MHYGHMDYQSKKSGSLKPIYDEPFAQEDE